MQSAGFWDDADAAAKVSSEHARTSRRLEEFRGLEHEAAIREQLKLLADYL
jgi:hypothetical protein